jgi:hypothetical protein
MLGSVKISFRAFLSALVLSIGCSPSTGAAPPSCESTSTCHRSCSIDTDCDGGYYCGSHTCTNDCSAKTLCDVGSTCTSRGQCVLSGFSGSDAGLLGNVEKKDGAPTSVTEEGGACVASTYEGESVPLDMFVMWDRSGSMGVEVNGGRKWDLVLAAFDAFLNDPQSRGISVGIQYFSLSDTPGQNPDDTHFSCNIPDYGVAAVPIAPLPANAAPISTALHALSPAGRTPTRVAMEGALKVATDWAAAHPSHKVVIVLQTDGDPNVCDSTVDAVSAVAKRGFIAVPSIPTYVIGVGTTDSLNAIAAAGGTTQALLVDTNADTKQQFIDAMNKVRGSAQVPCEFLLPDPGGGNTLDPTRVNVAFTPNGGARPTSLLQATNLAECDPATGGWFYDDNLTPTRITLCDASCGQVTADSSARVQVLLGCQSHPIMIR